MKICWDNLENLHFTKNGTWRIGSNTYIYKESCEICKEPFLSRIGNKGNVCSLSCAVNKHNYKWKRSETYKKNMSEIIKKLYRDGVYDDIEISGYRTVSKEEIEFREKLKQMLPLNYEYQKCIKVENKRKYVDIFISDKKTIIEYDGRHHFLPVYGKKRFEETQYDDKKLNEHCKKKNINLIRVNSFDYRKNKNKILSDIAGKILC